VKTYFESAWARRLLAGAAVAGALAVAAMVLHPPLAPVAPVRISSGDTERALSATDRPARGRSRAGAAVVVYVAGAVVKPGVYALASSARVVDALARAGGTTADADLVRVNLAAHLADGEEVTVLKRGEAVPAARRSAVPRRSSARKQRTASGDASDPPLDLNSAGADELAGLPGLGPALAARIVLFREVNGPFESVDELADVSGMTPAHLDALSPYLSVR
jgi:competence protein ComEA